MAIVDLGTLRVGVEAAGVENTNSRLGDFNKKVNQAEQGSNSASKGIKSLASSFKEGLANTTLFGNRLGDLKTQLGGGTGASSLLQGAVMGLTASFVNLALQGIQMVITGLAAFTQASITAASDLQENANVVNTVFGEDNAILEWSEKTAAAFNLSANEAQKFAGIFGAVMTPANLGQDNVEQMSMTLTQLSADLGSLWNKSNEEAFNALRSAITGETEPMKNFGVVMTQVNLEAFALSQGIDKSWQAMSQAEQTAIRYNYILENTKTAQGDVAKTTDSYANSSKQLSMALENAKTALGGGLLPALSSAKQGLAEFIGNNQELINSISNVVGFTFETIVEGVRIVMIPVNLLLKLINGIIGVFRPIGEFFRSEFSGFFKDVRSNATKTADSVGYEMLDMADVTKDAMGEASGEVSDSFKAMEDEATAALGNVKTALDEYYDKARRDYKKQLEDQYGDSKTAAIKIAEIMTRYDEETNRKKERDMEVYTRNYEAKYNQDYQNYAKYEEEKTKKAKEEAAKRGSSYVGGGGTTNRYANGTLSAQGGWSVVGEAGRELMYVPGGSKVVNNNTTEKILQGGKGNTFTGPITVMANNPQEFIEQMEMAYRSGVFA